MKKWLWVFALLVISSDPLLSQDRVGKIIIETKEVFEKGQKDWFFASPLLNSLHTKTRNYVIEDELLFKPEDLINDDYIYETERNLRASGLFTDVKIEMDSVSDDTYNVYVTTQDRWSTYPSALFGAGGGENNIGMRFEEFNLAGTGTYLGLEALHRSENNIGWQGLIDISQRRLFRTNFSLDAFLLSHSKRTVQSVVLQQSYLTEDTPYSFGTNISNTFGSVFLYNNIDTIKLAPFHDRNAKAWFSKAWWRNDRVFITGLVELNDVDRGQSKYRQAYDNSGKILVSFSSSSQEFHPVSKLNSYFTQDMPVGGWGTAILGKVFPMNSNGEGLYYVAAEGEKSTYYKDLYLFGRVIGASSFISSSGKYTYEEFYGSGFYKLADGYLLAGRIRQQTVWNWYALRQLVLDNDAGLRGYSANTMEGDNRLVANFEFRAFPDWQFWIFKFSGVAFYDIGSVWMQQVSLTKTRFHSSAGLGVRFHFTKSAADNHMFRLDFAYNFDKKKVGIVFTTSQLFNVFGDHSFRLPEMFGSEFDYE